MANQLETKKRTYKRRRYIIKLRFQLKYIGIIMAVMLVSALISGYTIYYNAWTMLGDKLAKVYPQGRLVEIFNAVNIKLAINLVFVSLFWICIGILVSHKIAGPIYRMIQFLGEVTAGDYSRRLTLRKGDELHDLAAAINKLVEKLEREKKS